MKTRYISVSGPSCSGKSSFSDLLVSYYGNRASKISLDNYYYDFSTLPFRERSEINLYDPASIDFELLRTHILSLQKGEEIKSYIYDCRKRVRTDQYEIISPCEVIIVDGGLLLHHDDIANLFDFKIYMDASESRCDLRRILRDDYKQDQNEESVLLTKGKSDFVLNNDTDNSFITTDITYLLDSISQKTGLPKYHRQSPNIVNPTKMYSINTETAGTLYVISGPSGVGKTTLIKRLVSSNHNLTRIIPYHQRKRASKVRETIIILSHTKYQELIKEPVLEHVTIFNNHFLYL